MKRPAAYDRYNDDCGIKPQKKIKTQAIGRKINGPDQQGQKNEKADELDCPAKVH